MADQTNPWGSAPSTDSAAQAADACLGWCLYCRAG